jgi:chromosome segregation ATPase
MLNELNKKNYQVTLEIQDKEKILQSKEQECSNSREGIADLTNEIKSLEESFNSKEAEYNNLMKELKLLHDRCDSLEKYRYYKGIAKTLCWKMTILRKRS